jgi:hypothetical protein
MLDGARLSMWIQALLLIVSNTYKGVSVNPRRKTRQQTRDKQTALGPLDGSTCGQ